MQKEIAKEYPHPREEQFAQEIIDIINRSLERDYGRGKYLRRFHVKSHGLVEAELKVEESLPPDLQVGLFKTCKTYKAWVRFSNASLKPESDEKKAVRGMAVKVLEVDDTATEKDGPGNSQDIVLTTNNVFFPGTVDMQVAAIKAVLGNPRQKIQGSLRLILSLQFGRLFKFLEGRVKPASVLEQCYASLTPYLFGQGKAVKWHARPVKAAGSTQAAPAGKDYLRKRLIEDLKYSHHKFDLCVQFQSDPLKQPVEDASIEWRTPLVKVGTITILQQEFDNEERNRLDQAISFSPWHSMAVHRPLGGINRMRRRIYDTLSKYRRNQSPGPSATPGV
jgi:hypothetical protein